MDSALPQAQRGWQITARGVPKDVLKLNNDLPVPTSIPQGHVLVKVLAAALNPVGYKLMALTPNFMVNRPRIAEADLAGEIVLSNGTEFSVGDEVFGILPEDENQKTGNGSMQEYAIVPTKHLVLKPKNIDFTTAAGVALVGLTAWGALVDMGGIEEGQRIFVNGGSSSVGGMAIMIAKAKGCTVDCSASGRNIDYVKGLGADQAFDYTASPLHEQLLAANISPPYNVIFDCVDASAPLFLASSKYLAPNGVYISTGPNVHTFSGLPSALWGMTRIFWPTLLGGTNRQFKIFLLTAATAGKDKLQNLADLIAEGKLKPQVDSVFAFEDLLKAYERILSGRAKGKVVVQLL